MSTPDHPPLPDDQLPPGGPAAASPVPPAPPSGGGVSTGVLVGALALALAVGGVLGWLVGESGSDSGTTTTVTTCRDARGTRTGGEHRGLDRDADRDGDGDGHGDGCGRVDRRLGGSDRTRRCLGRRAHSVRACRCRSHAAGEVTGRRRGHDGRDVVQAVRVAARLPHGVAEPRRDRRPDRVGGAGAGGARVRDDRRRAAGGRPVRRAGRADPVRRLRQLAAPRHRADVGHRRAVGGQRWRSSRRPARSAVRHADGGARDHGGHHRR